MKKIFFVLFLTFAACSQKASKTDGNPEKVSKSWPSQMQALAQTMADLIPYVSSEKKFNDPANKEVIEQQATRLQSLAHKIKDTKMLPDSDPSLSIISYQFEEDIKGAVEGLKIGHRDYARNMLRHTSSYCIQCHTRMDSGPEFKNLFSSPSIQAMTPLERGEFFAATRQFDQALKEFDTVLKQPRETNSFDWDKTIRYALSISVRFNKDPKKSLHLVDDLLKAKNLPSFLKEDALMWRKSIQAWQKEKPKKKMSVDDRFKMAQTLVQKGQKAQASPSDHGGDIYYMRASSLLHELMNEKMAPEQKSEGLYMLGLCYEALNDLSFWTLHEQYYEACIRHSPHTEVAKKCYKKYEDNTLAGFTGSQGLQLPADVQAKLDELKGLL